MQPRPGSIRYLLGGRFYRLAFEAWGDPEAPPVICVHGLTRNGRDFDALAEALANSYRVICPDLPGRGHSDWLDDPMLYQAQHYVTALAHLLAWAERDVAWIGTSLGGICGMVIAATDGAPVTRLVLNDVGPFIPAASLARIRDYMVASSELADDGALSGPRRDRAPPAHHSRPVRARSPMRNGPVWRATRRGLCRTGGSPCTMTRASPNRCAAMSRLMSTCGRCGTAFVCPAW